MASALINRCEQIDFEEPAKDLEPVGTGDDDYHDVRRLCGQLHRTDEVAQRDSLRSRIITRCLPLADHIAHRFVGRGEPADDLTQVARLGLIKAVDRYDPEKGPFLGYAVPTIMGEVRRHFRDHAWVVYVPRKIKDARQRMQAAIGPLAQRLGRAPTATDLAAELGLDRDEVVRLADATYAYQPSSLDAPAPGGEKAETVVARQGAEDPRYASIEDGLTVAELVSTLTERERLILRLRFCENLPQSQIGRALGLSQVHVSRLLAATLERLRQSCREQSAEMGVAVA
ncbi:B/F/G family RNA polymerase sigma-70 factor [Mycolicibacterium sp. GF69]|uniref:SigB/SigF/SigG family RNA polymerase sigma factor n=1 Tax=Mycolicibacterium sp. GF69 TaxID=2267251 RepID=UPI000DCBB948|nr:SigB/SigF/SigG family RNA polymerase sigma factor [Mycolicibacterium sp. GF69]RAV13192.1 B/F/G family RNA polymerase sigma-70 factor [Mycolicibacterium sp. GF69]